jgi:hypothetical protein
VRSASARGAAEMSLATCVSIFGFRQERNVFAHLAHRGGNRERELDWQLILGQLRVIPRI